MLYDDTLSFDYYNPTRLVFGNKAIQDTGAEIDSLGGQRVLIVTDKGVREAGLTDPVERVLGKRCVGIYDGCIQDSGVHIVDEGAAIAREKKVDALVSVGGGSVIDTAKCMAVLITEGGKLDDYEGLQLLDRLQASHVAIPTTAGTGSEATYVAIVKDWEYNVKKMIVDSNIIPRVAILDPMMTVDLPPDLTATTGMDAFTHGVEAIHSLQAAPISDAMALHAIRLIKKHLPDCVNNGENIVSRGQQLIASYMAGVAFGNAQVGLVHALAHSLGALFGVPHGKANSIVLPHVMKFNLDKCPEKYALIAEALGLEIANMSSMEAARLAVEDIQEMTKSLGIPQTLRECEVPRDKLEEVALQSLSDGSIVYNPKFTMDIDLVLPVLEEAW